MKNKKILPKLIGILAICVALFVYYYVTLPAINIHCVGFWYSAIGIFAVLTIIMVFLKLKKTHHIDLNSQVTMKELKPVFAGKLVKLFLFLTIAIAIIYFGGSILSSPIVNAKKYQQLINIQDSNFTDDIKQVSYSEIPILDKDSAILLGSRKMGNMAEYVSQFKVSTDYRQINYQGKPVRVSPLIYGNTIKWFTNHSKGIPAYMMIDMATQNVECVKLEDEIRYSKSELFGRNIYRYIRFKYPTYIFDELSFEINDEGTPYWICPVKDYTIGLFGGETVSRVVTVNAITGEHEDYAVADVPNWIDHVYNADLLVSYYDYYGTLKHGFINSIFGQRDCLQTTDGYNYIALNDDVWVYTGVTSVEQDKSNVGFILMNQRTAETKYYAVSGAEEYGAMDSAEGKVQHLGYKSTFPILLNIAGEPTYFMSLKDDAGLVKQYAMVNISKYNIVAIGESVTACESTYKDLLKSNNVTVTDTSTLPKVSGIIRKISEVVIGGNSHFYVLLEGDSSIYDFDVADLINIVTYNVGDTISFTYTEDVDSRIVNSIE